MFTHDPPTNSGPVPPPRMLSNPDVVDAAWHRHLMFFCFQLHPIGRESFQGCSQRHVSVVLILNHERFVVRQLWRFLNWLSTTPMEVMTTVSKDKQRAIVILEQ